MPTSRPSTSCSTGQALLGLLDLFSGGGLSRFIVVAIGINPYINASIIMQLMTGVPERIKEISKEGEQGRRRITRWTRYLTVALAFGQAYGFTVLFQNTSPAILPADMSWFQRLAIMTVMTAGTILAMWFGELITEHGIGNGVSLIIFAGHHRPGPAGGAGSWSHATGRRSGRLRAALAIAAVAVGRGGLGDRGAAGGEEDPIQSAQRLSGGRTRFRAAPASCR